MADIFLTLTQLEDLFVDLTVQALGIDTKTNPKAVRVSWPTGGAPAWKVHEEVVFLRVYEVDNQYNRQREVKITPIDDNNVNQETTYTRVIGVSWIFYGSSSFDRAAELKDKIFYQDFHDLLALSNVFLVPDVPAPARAPELYNGQWWQRTDLTMLFNEHVARNIAVPIIKSSQITVYADKDGEIDTSVVNVDTNE